MKIAIIGSTQYVKKFEELRVQLLNEGHTVRLPAFDHHVAFDELQVCEYNRSLIEWAEKVCIIWDRRSMGTILDFGMVFMARKPIQICYLEPKTIEGVMRKYELQNRGLCLNIEECEGPK